MLLEIEKLQVSYQAKTALTNISFSMKESEILGIVGESGSGKSTLLRSILRLTGRGGTIDEGRVLLRGQDLVTLPGRKMRDVRGKEIAMIFQSPELSLDPIMTIRVTLNECIKRNFGKVEKKSWEPKILEMFSQLDLDDCLRVLDAYPFELSGGMCQRVTIAIALLSNPALLLADEPTSALDVKSQISVIRALQKARDVYGTAILLVTHNMGLVNEMADHIGVMLKGKMVEYGTAQEVIGQPMHPYTKNLVSSVPKLDGTLQDPIDLDEAVYARNEKVFCGGTHWYLA